MVCWTYEKPNQTKEERKREIQQATANILRMIAANKAKIRIGPQGAIAFDGIPDNVRDGMADSCVYNGLRNNQAFARALARAEQMAGVKVNPAAVEAGIHSHGGQWYPGH